MIQYITYIYTADYPQNIQGLWGDSRIAKFENGITFDSATGRYVGFIDITNPLDAPAIALDYPGITYLDTVSALSLIDTIVDKTQATVTILTTWDKATVVNGKITKTPVVPVNAIAVNS